MHFCLGCVTDHKPTNFRQNLVQLIISIVIVAIAPFVFGFLNQTSLSQIRDNSPYKKFSQNVSYDLARVVDIQGEKVITDELTKSKIQDQQLTFVLTNGAERGKTVTQNIQTDASDPKQKYQLNDQIVIRREPKLDKPTENYYFILDKYRIGSLVLITLVFLVLVLLMAGLKGISSILGLVFSVMVIVQLLIPGILSGNDLLGLTLATSLVILTFTLYLGHGFNKKTSVSLIASLITITFATLFAIWAVDAAALSGYGNDDTFHLKTNGITGNLNLRGLLLSSMIIGSIGVLDDVTTAQAVAIEEISKANPFLTTKELFFRGMTVGKEHVISLVNTLAIAYVGSSMPLLLMFSTFNFSPLWVIINDQVISEEIVRSVVGSACLLLAIPISTLISARFLRSEKIKPKEKFSFGEAVR
jgi:uncharacterized membrane protein